LHLVAQSAGKQAAALYKYVEKIRQWFFHYFEIGNEFFCRLDTEQNPL